MLRQYGSLFAYDEFARWAVQLEIQAYCRDANQMFPWREHR